MRKLICRAAAGAAARRKAGFRRFAVAAQLLRVPELDAVAYADEGRLARQARDLAQRGGDEHAALLVRLAGGGHRIQPAPDRLSRHVRHRQGGQLFGKQLPLRHGHAEQAGGAAVPQQAERDDEQVAHVVAPLGGYEYAALRVERMRKRTDQHPAAPPSCNGTGPAFSSPGRTCRPARKETPSSCAVSIHHFAPFVTT